MTGKFPKPAPDYRCPLCPDHKDDVFVWNSILGTPICEGCDYELWDAVVCEETRQPTSRILDSLEQHTSLSFEDYRIIELEHCATVMAKNPNTDQKMLSYIKNEIVRLRSGRQGSKWSP